MRALCEACQAPQPVDWRPGDLCVACGLAVRAEARCHWCATWAPHAKFCRKCGAAAIGRHHYGAARMLKHLGASIFEIPSLLADLDPAQIDTYSAIYATHAAVAHRHVELARALGQQLYLRQWAQEMEDSLVPQLPWPDEKLAAYSTATSPEESPFALIRDLAELASMQAGVFNSVSLSLLQSPNPSVAAEAALHLSGWRALFATRTGAKRPHLIPPLLQSPLPEHAAPRLAALGHEPPPAFSLTGHPDTDFLIVLLEKNRTALEQSLHHPDPERRYVAASQLIFIGAPENIGPALRSATPGRQLELLREITSAKRPVPNLHTECFDIFLNADDHRLCRAAASAIVLNRHPADLLRLIDLSNASHDIVHAVLLSKPAPETYSEIGRRLVETEKFDSGQWGLDLAAKPGAMPLGFVLEHFPSAPPAMQCHLLRFAENQVEAHGVERSPLERLIIRQCLAPGTVEVIATAWACIHRIQMHRRVGLTVPCDLSLENVEWCWTMPELLAAIAQLMANPEAVGQPLVRDDFDRFLRSAEPEFFAAAVHWPDECRRVIRSAPLADPYIYALRFAESLRL